MRVEVADDRSESSNGADGQHAVGCAVLEPDDLAIVHGPGVDEQIASAADLQRAAVAAAAIGNNWTGNQFSAGLAKDGAAIIGQRDSRHEGAGRTQRRVVGVGGGIHQTTELLEDAERGVVQCAMHIQRASGADHDDAVRNRQIVRDLKLAERALQVDDARTTGRTHLSGRSLHEAAVVDIQIAGTSGARRQRAAKRDRTAAANRHISGCGRLIADDQIGGGDGAAGRYAQRPRGRIPNHQRSADIPG